MPLIVPCDELQPGMRLSEAFTFNGRVMLPGGKTLSADDLDILRRKYPEATLKIGDPLLDSITEFEDDSRDRKTALTAQQTITECMADVQQRFAANTNIARVNFNAVRNAAVGVIEFLQNNPVSVALLSRSNNAGDYLAEHSGNVFYLAMVLGCAVRDYVIRERMRQTSASNLSAGVAMDLVPLGLGAMFMDLGMQPLQHVFKKDYELTDEDRRLLREHPQAGADMLPDSMPPAVKMIVRAHHENFDGSGYPAGTMGATQHVFTRIVRVCDAYEAATASRVYAAAKSPARALWEMTAGPYRHCYDLALTKVFMSFIQPFPIGARLKLADGRYAVVVRYNRKQPFQPHAIIAFDEHKKPLPKEQLQRPLNIGDNNPLRLASFESEDLSYLYEPSPPSPACPTATPPATPQARTFEALLHCSYP